MSILKFRILLFVELLASLIGAAIDEYLYNSNLKEIIVYSESFAPVLTEAQDTVYMVFLVTALMIMLAGLFGLFFLKNWARYLYVSGFVFALPVYFISGITILSPAASILNDFSCLCGGIIIAVMFFSPFKNEFKKAL